MATHDKDVFEELVVNSVSEETKAIRTFELMRSDGTSMHPFEAGAHVLVRTPSRHVRNYSLCNAPVETHRYVIAVKREENGRGGSRSMFDDIRTGSRLLVSPPRNLFALPKVPRKVILIAGGIGITPILAMLHALRAQKTAFKLVYCTRSVEETAFYGLLNGFSAENAISFHHDEGDPAQAFAFAPLLADWEESLDVYCCGPKGLMDAVRQATTHWPAANVHFEDFASSADVGPRSDRAFTVTIDSTGETFEIPPDKTILQVLNENGLDVWSSCEQGVCGTCKTRLIAGEVDHRDRFLDQSERKNFLTVCVSRAISDNLVIEPE